MRRFAPLALLFSSLYALAAGACSPDSSTTDGGKNDDDGSPGGSGGSGAAGGGSLGGAGGGQGCNESDPTCCSPDKPCEDGLECCNGGCVDTKSEPSHCGQCDKPCPDLANASEACNAGMCALGECEGSFVDCDQQPGNGCEWDTASSGPCSCEPGATQPCYTGPPGTENVGACTGGTQTCDPSGTSWGPCFGQVLPLSEKCDNGIDEDCNGVVDDVPDIDGDGWTACEGDCCEIDLDCTQPTLVNPGAFDVSGNALDDDCDGTIDNVVGPCDGALASNSNSAMDYAFAIDLCKTTVEQPATPKDQTWGVISANLFLANGQGSPSAQSRSIRTGFGNAILPLQGGQLAVLSTGRAAAQAAPNDANPPWAPFQGGQNMGTTSGVPADWLAANGNNFPNAPGCPDPQGGTTANDPVMLKLRVRVPTNAKSFAVSTYFFSSEYPEWVCSPFNDFFLALLDSAFVPGPGETPNPADKNLAFYDPAPAGPPFYPVGVNLAFGNTGLFQQCKNGPTGCGGGSVPGNVNTCVGTNELVGTGFDIANPPSQFADDPGYCGASNLAGGGTGWLTTSGNVAPGETIELRFVIWDTGDPWYDSLVLLDNFTWSVDAAEPGTHN